MNQYYKTQLGIDTLQSRSKDLNARQRRLLVLIGTEDFNLLTDQFKQRIATPELLEQLSALGLIYNPQLDQQSQHSEIQFNIENVIQTQQTSKLYTDPKELQTNLKNQEIELTPLTPLSQQIPKNIQSQNHFDELNIHQIQTLMIELLEQYCGLMAKPLIIEIKKSQNLSTLKMCQIQWITHLQESRIAPTLLNQYLQQINYSIHQLMHS